MDRPQCLEAVGGRPASEISGTAQRLTSGPWDADGWSNLGLVLRSGVAASLSATCR